MKSSSEGEQRYGFNFSSTSVQDGSGGSKSRPGHFTPGQDPVPIV